MRDSLDPDRGIILLLQRRMHVQAVVRTMAAAVEVVVAVVFPKSKVFESRLAPNGLAQIGFGKANASAHFPAPCAFCHWGLAFALAHSHQTMQPFYWNPDCV